MPSRRGWEVTAEYVDLGVSGSRESRPELNRMLAAAHARAFDAVVCWKLDRLGRSLKHLVTTIEDLSAYGVAFISLRDNLDLSTPSGRLMMHIIGAMAQFERELIKERVSAGMHAARKRGSRIGRPRAYANADKIRALRAQDVPWRSDREPSWASAPVQLSGRFKMEVQHDRIAYTRSVSIQLSTISNRIRTRSLPFGFRKTRCSPSISALSAVTQ